MTHLLVPHSSSPTYAHASRLRRRVVRNDEGVSRVGLGIVLMGIVAAVVWNYLGGLWAEQLIENEVCKVFESCDDGDDTGP